MPTTSAGTVLLVDDDEMFLRACGNNLRREGLTVDPVSSMAAALVRLRERRYDVVVSDIQMPGGDGLSLLRAARATDAEVPFVLMTGHATVETAIEAVEFGAVRYLSKPFDVDHFTSVVREAIARRSAARRRDDASFDLALSRIWMAYQPIVRWSGRKTVAFEALVRCGLPEVPGPLELLALAERTGRVHELGRAIRRLVAADAAVLPSAVTVFVNLHPSDLGDPSLSDGSEPLAQMAHRVVLEITERASVTGIDRLEEEIEKLRRLGYRIAIDDLGAGYAGLTSLARVRPEFVKLDQSLIRGLPESPTQQVIVASVLALCTKLRSEVIAEAIETEGERDWLVAMGLDWMQGYYFARPSPPFIQLKEGVFSTTRSAAA